MTTWTLGVGKLVFMFIINEKWLGEVLSDARTNGSKEYVEYILDGCREVDILPYDLATDALNKGMYDSDDLLGLLLERTCGKDESITDVATSILQEDIVKFIKDDLLHYKHMVIILDRVWLFTERDLTEWELEDMAGYRFANGIVTNRDYETTEEMYVYRIDREFYKQTKLHTGNVVLTLIEEMLVEY